jgi:DNA-directed RNA polymerase subunit M/transcription elongation factor TFIIS
MAASPSVSDLKSVTCPNCGASLSYKPGTTSLVCEHCGSSFQIQTENATAADAQKENDLLAALAGNWQSLQTQAQAFVVKCPACGAETALEQNVFASACAFCGSPLTVKPDERAVAHPQAVLPFKIDKAAGVAFFQKWLRKLWFAPNNLKKTASADRFNGVYLPFWTFDAATQTDYRGERGDHYTETRTVMVNGKQETERVTKTRWSSASGQVQRAFNDILVTASRAIPEKYLNALEPWDLPNLAAYDNRYLSGFKAEVSQVNIAEGYDEAKKDMAGVIEKDIRHDIGGDEQRISSVNTRYDRQTYKYILLPVWLSVYRYGNKIYRFVVNARTGEVHGERPWSWIKIALAVIVVLVVIGVLVYFFGQH